MNSHAGEPMRDIVDANIAVISHLSFSGMKRMDTTVVRVGTTGMHFMDKLGLKMAFLIA